MSTAIDSSFEIYPWQREVWRLFTDTEKAGRMPHAILLSGPEGVGKMQLASCLAKFLLCQNNSGSGTCCGECRACRLMLASSHPDYREITVPGVERQISVDQIRDLGKFLSLSPQYDQYRVAVILPAESLSPAAVNALLKTLEEPPARTVLILVTAVPWYLPATIRSRCQKFELNVPAECRVTKEWLAARTESDRPVDVLLNLADGAPLKALQIDLDGGFEKRSTFFSLWIEIAANRLNPVNAVELLDSLPMKAVFHWAMVWTVDMIRLKMYPSTTYLNNPDMREALQAASKALELNSLFSFYDSLVQTVPALDKPINARLMLERVLVDWSLLRRAC